MRRKRKGTGERREARSKSERFWVFEGVRGKIGVVTVWSAEL